MRTLRPPRPSQIEPHPDEDAHARTSNSDANRADRQTNPILPIVVVVATVLIIAAFAIRGGAVQAPPPTSVAAAPSATLFPTATFAPTTNPATPTPSCTSASEWLKTVNHYAERGDWLAASQNAEVGLSDKSTCAEDRQKLAQLMVSYGLKSILAEKFVPQDMQGQLASVDRYRSIKRRAADLEVDFPSSLQIATDAYSVGQFPVAKAAFEDAYTEGAFNRADQTLLQNYSSTLYNIGAWWMQGDSNGEAYTIGSRMLVTSYYVDQTYGTGHGEAEALLKQKLGADKTTWPSPLDIPLPLDLKEMR